MSDNTNTYSVWDADSREQTASNLSEGETIRLLRRRHWMSFDQAKTAILRAGEPGDTACQISGVTIMCDDPTDS